MTDNEIIKALDGADVFLRNRANSEPAPLNEYDIEALIDIANVCDEAANLINHKNAEIERLKETKNRLSHNLQAVLDERADHSDAVKEFEERAIKNICEKVYAPTPVQSCIVEKCNQVIIETAKEMAGEG